MALSLDAPHIPVTHVALPVSAETLELRRLKGVLHEIRLETNSLGGPGSEYANIMRQYSTVANAISTRPVKSWSDCVELAEICWHHREKEWIYSTTGRLAPSSSCFEQATNELIEGVLTLGRGERNDPSIVSAEERERWNRGTYRRGVGWIMDRG